MNHAASIRVKSAVMHKEVRRSATDLENRLPIALYGCWQRRSGAATIRRRAEVSRQNARKISPTAFLMNVIVSAL